MTTEQSRRLVRAGGLAAVAVVGFLALTVGEGSVPRLSATQKDKAAAPRCRLKEKPADPGKNAPGANYCRGCHSGADMGQAAGYVRKYKSNEFVLLDEATTWDQKDVHSIAYANLSGPLGQKMEKALGYNVARDPKCLTCHSVDLAPDIPLGRKEFKQFATNETGVNCTLCHGLGRNWQFEHSEEPTMEGEPLPWREKTPRAKFDRGMHDLRNPAVKARLCTSCHVGCADEGKVVTHEMYAAGHPPLPPFELASFVECEPKHWAYPTDPRLAFFTQLAEKSPDKTWPLYHFFPAAKEVYLARNLAAGAIAALEADLNLIAADAGAVASNPEAAGMDYARFDCYACHHDLKYPSDRQARGYEGPPGRPPLKAWVGVLPEVVAKHAEGLDNPELKAMAAEFGPRWQAVRKAAVARPFGHPAELQQAAGKLADWCDGFLKILGDAPAPVYTPQQAERLLDTIAAAGGSPRWAADPEAAMQLTWAYLTLRADLKKPADGAKLEELKKVVAVRVRDPEHYSNKETKKPYPVESYLRPRLQKIAGHDAAAFRRAFLDLTGGMRK